MVYRVISLTEMCNNQPLGIYWLCKHSSHTWNKARSLNINQMIWQSDTSWTSNKIIPPSWTSNKIIPPSSNLVWSVLLQLCYKTWPITKWYCTFEVLNSTVMVKELNSETSAKLYLELGFYAGPKTWVWTKNVLN